MTKRDVTSTFLHRTQGTALSRSASKVDMHGVRLLSLLMVTGLVGLAEPPWEKPSSKWTEKDARRILSDSPWAKTITTKASAQKDRTLTVRWESAAPVQIALRRVGIAPAIPANESYRAIAVLGATAQPRDWSLEEIQRWPKPTAWLQSTGKTLITPSEVRILLEDQETPLVLFLFPKTAENGDPRVFRLPLGIVLHQREATFTAQIGPVAIKQRFPFKDMIYLDQFAP